MTLSIVIPARNEEGHLTGTVSRLMTVLERAQIPYEVVIVNDHSTDGTAACARQLQATSPFVRVMSNEGPPGFGVTIRVGLAHYAGDVVAIMMADGSDDPQDVVTYYQKHLEGYDCVFGSRFIRGGVVTDYPFVKLCFNRLANAFIQVLFRLPHNDITNAFKCYSRRAIEGVQPLVTNHFNLTVELPLKAIVRGYSYATVPIRWTQREHGASKLKIQEMASRYLFVILSIFFEKHLSRGDYRRGDQASAEAVRAGMERPAAEVRKS